MPKLDPAEKRLTARLTAYSKDIEHQGYQDYHRRGQNQENPED